MGSRSILLLILNSFSGMGYNVIQDSTYNAFSSKEVVRLSTAFTPYILIISTVILDLAKSYHLIFLNSNSTLLSPNST